MAWRPSRSYFFFFNDTATTEIYTLSLHDALPISKELSEKYYGQTLAMFVLHGNVRDLAGLRSADAPQFLRSEEHTSELQSQSNLVCRLLLEKKNNSISRHMLLNTHIIF